jgi:hypothetical protein
MKIKRVIENDQGTFNVDCDFSVEEFDSIIEIGLNVLLAHGALPFMENPDSTFDVVAPHTLEVLN